MRRPDVFDLVIPSVDNIPGLEVRPVESAWGPAENPPCVLNGHVVGSLHAPYEPTYGLLPQQIELAVMGWDVICWRPIDDGGLSLPPDVQVGLLGDILRAAPGWLVHCEFDCDQKPLKFATMSPQQVVDRLQRGLGGDRDGFDFVGWASGLLGKVVD